MLSLQESLKMPLNTLDDMFSRSINGQLNEPNMTMFTNTVKSLFSELLSDPEITKTVPLLDKSYFESGRLEPDTIVRYRGIIQDILNPEFFIGAYTKTDKSSGEKVWIQSKYKECITCDADSCIDFDGPGVITLERLPLVLAPVPGESSWVQAMTRTKTINPSRDCMTKDYDHVSEHGSKKRISDIYDDEQQFERNVNMRAETDDNTDINDMMIHKNNMDAIQDRLSDNPDAICCLAKVCDFKDDDFHLNDIIEILAIYTLDRTPIMELDDDDKFDDSINLPQSIMPHLQILSYRKLDSSYPLICRMNLNGGPLNDKSDICIVNNDCIGQPKGSTMIHLPSLQDTVFPLAGELMKVREALVNTLSTALAGQLVDRGTLSLSLSRATYIYFIYIPLSLSVCLSLSPLYYFISTFSIISIF